MPCAEQTFNVWWVNVDLYKIIASVIIYHFSDAFQGSATLVSELPSESKADFTDNEAILMLYFVVH